MDHEPNFDSFKSYTQLYNHIQSIFSGLGKVMISFFSTMSNININIIQTWMYVWFFFLSMNDTHVPVEMILKIINSLKGQIISVFD